MGTFDFGSKVRPDEAAHIVASREDPELDPSLRARPLSVKPLAGLALSGGGIRSATFNLGILQALACAGKLSRFDYLSTVSGGGYIGGWLTAWIHRKGLKAVERELARTAPHTAEEPHEIKWLRAHSNYLTPRKGVLSIDTLWGACTYIRNLVINQLLLIAMVVAFMLACATAHELLMLISRGAPFGLGVAGSFLLIAAAPLMGFEFAALRGQVPKPWSRRFICWLQRGPSSRIIVACFILGSFIVAYALPRGGTWLMPGDALPEDLVTRHWKLVLLYGSAFFAYWMIAWFAAAAAFEPPQDQAIASSVRPGWGLVFAVAGATVVFAVLQAQYAVLMNDVPDSHNWLIALLGTLGYVVVVETSTLMLILFAGRSLRAFAHDWLSRMAAMIIAMGLLPLAVFVNWVLLVPAIDYLQGLALSGALLAWIGTTAAGVLGGKSKATGAITKPWVDRLLGITPFVFLLGLLALVAWGAREVLEHFAGVELLAYGSTFGPGWLMAVERNLLILGEAIRTEAWAWSWAIAMIVLIVLALRVDINLFSFHSYYRNRLAHAYLGASAEKRRANAFTGYAPADSPVLYRLKETLAGKALRPYPLVNTALNLTGTSRSEWQERKAASFILSPLYCGFELPQVLDARLDTTTCPENARPGGPVPGFQPTHEFVNGKSDRQLSLAIAIAISGAAASPNMGYHTSKALAALMTVFNVRLGWWLPNPVHQWAWRKGGPDLSLAFIVAELMGNANEDSPYVYVSDGGHFENLGVYELLRRRCPIIVACDGSADSTSHFEDLANLIRKARVDFLVDIEIDASSLIPTIGPDGVIGASARNFVTGRVRYPATNEGDPPEVGWLVYVKSSIPSSLPTDIDNYRRGHASFPHQSTADQWFDEQQFESYRRLGLAIGEAMLQELPEESRQRGMGW